MFFIFIIIRSRSSCSCSIYTTVFIVVIMCCGMWEIPLKIVLLTKYNILNKKKNLVILFNPVY